MHRSVQTVPVNSTENTEPSLRGSVFSVQRSLPKAGQHRFGARPETEERQMTKMTPIDLPELRPAADDLIDTSRYLAEQLLRSQSVELQAAVAARTEAGEPMAVHIQLMPKIVVAIWLGTDVLAEIDLTREVDEPRP
jgi:hypothetical protein